MQSVLYVDFGFLESVMRVKRKGHNNVALMHSIGYLPATGLPISRVVDQGCFRDNVLPE